MRDDLAPLAAYGLVDEDPTQASTAASTSFWDTWSFKGRDSGRRLKRIQLIGSKEVSGMVDDKLISRAVPVQEETVEKALDDEETVVGKIGEISGKGLDELEPEIAKLEAWLAQEKSGTVTEGEESAVVLEKPNPRTSIWLSEALLQNLLRLDGFEIPSTYTDARKTRKDAVKKLQSALDRVDALKEELKARL